LLLAQEFAKLEERQVGDLARENALDRLLAILSVVPITRDACHGHVHRESAKRMSSGTGPTGSSTVFDLSTNGR